MHEKQKNKVVKCYLKLNTIFFKNIKKNKYTNIYKKINCYKSNNKQF